MSADELPCVVPPYADPAGVAVLRKVNRQLDDPIVPSSVDLLLDARPRPGRDAGRADRRRCTPLVEQWDTAIAQAGARPRAATSRVLVDEGDEQTLPGPRDQLGAAVDALADALAENRRLRHQVDALERERDRLDRSGAS